MCSVSESVPNNCRKCWNNRQSAGIGGGFAPANSCESKFAYVTRRFSTIRYRAITRTIQTTTVRPWYFAQPVDVISIIACPFVKYVKSNLFSIAVCTQLYRKKCIRRSIRDGIGCFFASTKLRRAALYDRIEPCFWWLHLPRSIIFGLLCSLVD